MAIPRLNARVFAVSDLHTDVASGKNSKAKCTLECTTCSPFLYHVFVPVGRRGSQGKGAQTTALTGECGGMSWSWGRPTPRAPNPLIYPATPRTPVSAQPVRALCAMPPMRLTSHRRRRQEVCHSAARYYDVGTPATSPAIGLGPYLFRVSGTGIFERIYGNC